SVRSGRVRTIELRAAPVAVPHGDLGARRVADDPAVHLGTALLHRRPGELRAEGMTIQLGFSTLGEPRMPTQTIAELIEDTGIRGLEMRIAEGEPLTADSAPSTAVGIRNALEGAHPL